MVQQLQDVTTRLMSIQLTDLLDIVLVAAIFYGMLYIVRGTRAVQLLRGVLLLALLVFVLSNTMDLVAFTAVLQLVLPGIIVAIPVIFQPELRRALERLGRANLLLNRGAEPSGVDRVVAVISEAVRSLSDLRYGALIVLERETGLSDLAERGLALDAAISRDLLLQIFHPNTPLHDGAVIVRDGRVFAARVIIPLTDDLRRAQLGSLGTRHLAAIAVTSSTDALAVVVSEETGTISLASDGRLNRHLDETSLAQLLRGSLEGGGPSAQGMILGAGRRLPGWLSRLREAFVAPDEGSPS